MLEQTAPAAMGTPAPVAQPASSQPLPAQAQPAAIGQAVQSVPATATNGQSTPQPMPDQAPAEQAPAQPSAAKSGQTHPRPAYVPAPAIPTQDGPRGARYDFNEGCRVALPETGKPWRVRISDLDTGNILYETEIAAGRVSSTKQYFIRFRLELWQAGESILTHEYSAEAREVLIQFPVGTLGDTMGWFPYAVKFVKKHRCKLTCAMAEKLIPLFKDAYPDIRFVTEKEVETEREAEPQRYYASYRMGLFFDDKECIHQPTDFRFVGLHRTAGYILGVDPTEEPPKIALAANQEGGDSRPIPEPYVCIAVQASSGAKMWNNPMGWHEITRLLKEAGYRVICIDQRPVHGTGLMWNHIPHGVEDETGDRPLLERARWLKHAEFFIGLSSGLSWIAWAMDIPVVLISGFTAATNEFATPYRVINYHACNGCWNDPHHRFDHHDFLWCPRHAGTPRQFECTRLITAEQVRQAIQKIPGFGAARAKNGGRKGAAAGRPK
jgi:autotransporter strand-loop-strand O-heptosyltransferase